jgi:hypothetical protein
MTNKIVGPQQYFTQRQTMQDSYKCCYTSPQNYNAKTLCSPMFWCYRS